MHGIIFNEVKRFTDTTLGDAAWRNILKESGAGLKVYLAGQVYPDEELVALLSAASKITDRPVPAILEDLGEFIVPSLIALAGPIVQPHWRLLELLENTEELIHSMVRARHPGAAPPQLRVTRTGSEEVTIAYDSARRLCPLVHGMVRGLARHYRQPATIEETACMYRGAEACLFSVRTGG